MPSAFLSSLLRCPHCRGPLVPAASASRCEACATVFPVSASGQIDARPRKPVSRAVTFDVLPEDPLWSGTQQIPLKHSPRPFVVAELLPRAPRPGAVALEIGAGNASLRKELEAAGWTYVGMDYFAKSVELLADVHALPFDDGAFDLIVCKALLEHVRFPHLAVREMARVLAPGGEVAGDVAFLQPFHHSYYHMTHAAIVDIFTVAGLEVTMVGNGEGKALGYLAGTSPVPRPASLLLRAVAAPADFLQRALMRLKRRVLRRDDDGLIAYAVGVVFRARKP